MTKVVLNAIIYNQSAKIMNSLKFITLKLMTLMSIISVTKQ